MINLTSVVQKNKQEAHSFQRLINHIIFLRAGQIIFKIKFKISLFGLLMDYGSQKPPYLIRYNGET